MLSLLSPKVILGLFVGFLALTVVAPPALSAYTDYRNNAIVEYVQEQGYTDVEVERDWGFTVPFADDYCAGKKTRRLKATATDQNGRRVTMTVCDGRYVNRIKNVQPAV